MKDGDLLVDGRRRRRRRRIRLLTRGYGHGVGDGDVRGGLRLAVTQVGGHCGGTAHGHGAGAHGRWPGAVGIAGGEGGGPGANNGSVVESLSSDGGFLVSVSGILKAEGQVL